MDKTNHSTLHTVYNIQQSAMQGSNDTTHRLSRRTAATTRFSPEGIGCQKQTAPRFCQHPIRWAFTSQAFTWWLHSHLDVEDDALNWLKTTVTAALVKRSEISVCNLIQHLRVCVTGTCDVGATPSATLWLWRVPVANSQKTSSAASHVTPSDIAALALSTAHVTDPVSQR